MDNKEKDSETIILEQLAYINDCHDNGLSIPYEEKRKTLLMIGMNSKIKEKGSVFKVSNLSLRHHCYDVLQLSYRIISKEASFTINNLTDENFIIIIEQYGITLVLEQYLKQEKEIPLEVLIKMSNRTIHAIDKSAKVFKKINNIRR